ncbi:SCO family protein [Variovorax sp. GT1P44]|uniref:SCO family protein n=1 Tax=Variovorax sp. GT1P44 TaxID=3443742 RepID=UPI003F4668B2
MSTATSTGAAPACCCGGAPTAAVTPPVKGAYDLVDHFGQPVTERSYAGRFQLIFFGFTHCAVVCPRELAKLTRTLELLGDEAARLQPLYISVDPARDTPARMRTFLAGYHPAFVGLTGTQAQVDSAKANFRIFATRKEDAEAPGGYVVPHTAISYLLDREGRYLAHFGDTIDPVTMARRLTSTFT